MVAASQITYGDKKVTITVDALVDDQEYKVVVKDAEDAELFSGTVVYDFNIPTELKVDSKSVNAVVGEEVAITYTLVDEDGDPIEGEEVRVQAKTGTTIHEQEILTTDAEGKVTFKYSTIDAGKQTVEAVVISKPTVRQSVTVDWVASSNQVVVSNPTADGFIVNTNANVDPKTQTIKYVVKFTDEQGQPIADGKTVYVNLQGLTGTATTAGDDKFISGTNVDGTLYSTTLSNGDGTAVLEFTTDRAEKITPTFYYAGDDAITKVADFTETHARAKAKTVEVVDGTTQKPTFTLELKSGKNDNANVEEKDGKLLVQEGSAAQFTLTAKDQYGNPFIGFAAISHNVALDDIASNDYEFGSIKFDVDDVDGGYDADTGVSSINFGTIDSNGDGVVELQVSSGNAGDKTQFTVWFDRNGNGKLDSGEGIESKVIEFVDAVSPKVATLEASADVSAVLEGNPVTYTVALKGADGKAFNASANNQGVIVKLYKDGKLVDQTGSIKATHTAGATGTFTAAGKDLKGTVNAANGKLSFSVTPAAGDAGSEYYAVVYIDLNGDGAVQSDEKVSVTTPKVNVIAMPNSLKAELVNADENEFVAGELVELKLTALNSGNATEEKFNGKYNVEVLLSDDTSSPSGEKKYIRTVTFNKGVATVSVPAELVANDDILVSMLDTGLTGLTADVGSGADDDDIIVTAGEPVNLAIGAGNTLSVVDAFGNANSDFNYSGVATFASQHGTLGGITLDAEKKAVITITNGAVQTATFTVDGNANTVDTLKITLSNGKELTFSE